VPQLWVSDRTAASAITEVVRKFGQIAVEKCSPEALEQRIGEVYSETGDAARLVNSMQDEVDIGLLMQEVERTQDLLASEDDAPVIRILNALLLEAAKEGASDIHIEAYETHSAVRMRVDGQMREIARPKRELHKALISRLKIMAGLDIAESRLPQDGRISTRLGNRMIDIRVSTLPNAYGERAVLRLLDKSSNKLTLESAGMSSELLARFDHLVRQPHGIILVTGPTGSGKTTTLYSALKRLDASSMNILTVEDPIEYELAGIGQTQINAKIGFTFAEALRSILRQDPDVVMVGEIRDTETAQIAIQASLTGHLVIATLHTNDAPSAVTRLMEMGVEPYLLASSVLGVMAQRLVRKCDPLVPGQLRGRVGIYELLVVDDRIKDLINQQAHESDIRRAAIASGMQTMRTYGEALVAQGITTQAEVLMATAN
ncbi:MAG: GspE/PulE family protein, partial [Comamonas sp.]